MFKMKNVSWLSVIVTMVLTVAVMAAGSSLIYSNYVVPGFVDDFVGSGYRFVDTGDYESAILEFEKALQLDPDNTEIMSALAESYMAVGRYEEAEELIKRIGDKGYDNSSLIMLLAEYYISEGRYDDAVRVLGWLGSLDKDIDVEKFANMLINLNVYNPIKAYEMLMEYVNNKGRENLEPVIEELVAGSEMAPEVATPIPASGDYARSFVMTSPIDSKRIGHGVYYTIAGYDEPQLFAGEYFVDHSMVISLLAFSPKETAEVVTVTYTLDSTTYNNAMWLLGEAETLAANTEEGVEVGNCIEGAKEPFETAIAETRQGLEKEFLTAADATELYTRITTEYTTFQSKIIPDTDKSGLVQSISTARERYNNTVEGTRAGNQRRGSRQALLSKIEAAEAVNNDILASQDTIDGTASNLDYAVTTFNNSVVTQVEQEITDRGGTIGAVTVTMGWNTIDDIDLHVKAPSGETVYYGNKVSRCGGRLQVDLQVSDYVSNPVENITWNNAPRGTYHVYVDVYSNRTRTSKPVTVQVIVDKMTVGTYTVYVNGDSDKYICSFTY